MPKDMRHKKAKAGDVIDKIARDIRMIVFDFDGVFTDNKVFVLEDGKEAVLCSRADGFGIEAVRDLGVKLMVLSKEQNPIVSVRCRKLNLSCIQGCDNKMEVLKKEAKAADIPLKNIAYLGNDINDIECLAIVGLPACVSDAHPRVIKLSKFITNKRGGDGAVREFCDYIASVKKQTKIRDMDGNF